MKKIDLEEGPENARDFYEITALDKISETLAESGRSTTASSRESLNLIFPNKNGWSDYRLKTFNEPEIYYSGRSISYSDSIIKNDGFFIQQIKPKNVPDPGKLERIIERCLDFCRETQRAISRLTIVRIWFDLIGDSEWVVSIFAPNVPYQPRY
eukprot:GHVP01055983.1.p1 GENE.GHVP01055983.1~~GHVP01055983.1.p1  ORF type:complete len:154 (+),score=18.88 GHVP01055983.1:1316-1777(+)